MRGSYYFDARELLLFLIGERHTVSSYFRVEVGESSHSSIIAILHYGFVRRCDACEAAPPSSRSSLGSASL